jgi:trans-2,3-dihydro-3-hydroxyanthranilate isomerase
MGRRVTLRDHVAWVAGGVSMDGVLMVQACLRDGRGGNPTAVIMGGAAMSDLDPMTFPARTGASHVAAVSRGLGRDPVVRFFTAAGELLRRGHGTVAAITGLALCRCWRPIARPVAGRGSVMTVSGVIESLAGGGATATAWFDQAIISRRDATNAVLLMDGHLDSHDPTIAVDQGDALGNPSTV